MVRCDNDDRAWLVELLQEVGDAAELVALRDTDHFVFMGSGSSDRLLNLTQEGK